MQDMTTIARCQFQGAAVSGYHVEIDDGEGFRFAGEVECPAHTVDGLTPGTAYRFRVRAENQAGKSSFSKPTEGVTGATLPGSTVVLSQMFATWCFLQHFVREHEQQEYIANVANWKWNPAYFRDDHVTQNAPNELPYHRYGRTDSCA